MLPSYEDTFLRNFDNRLQVNNTSQYKTPSPSLFLVEDDHVHVDGVRLDLRTANWPYCSTMVE
jgi:hypothetical protein